MANISLDLRHYARIGAGIRLQQLDVEKAAITRQFPELGGAGRRSRMVAPGGGALIAAAPRKRKMSAAGRAAIIAGTKKRWAEWRKKKG